MADTPVTSGSDLTSNTGNAGLGIGGGGGVQYAANPVTDQNLNGVNATLDKVFDQDAQMQVLRYKQRQKDLDDLSQMLSETGGSAFNIKGDNGQNMSFAPLKQDQQALIDSARETHNEIIAHPESAHYSQKVAELRQKHQWLVQNASNRAVFAADANTMAAKSNDAAERQAILDNRDRQLQSNVKDFAPLDPHLPALSVKPTIVEKDYEDDKKLQSFGTKIQSKQTSDGGSVDYQVESKGIPNTALLSILGATPLSDEYNNARNIAYGFQQLPQFNDPKYISAINEDIQKRAAARGIQPVFPATIGPDGKVVINPDPREVTAALNIEKYGGFRTTEKPTDERMKQMKESAEIGHIAQENKKILSDIQHARKEEEIAAGKLKIDQSKENREELEAAQGKIEANSAVATVLKISNDARSKGKFTTLDKIKLPPNTTTEDISSALTNNGIDPSNYTVSLLNAKDQGIQNLAGEQAQKANGDETQGVNKPISAFYVKSKTGNINDDRYLVFYRKINPEGIGADGKQSETSATIEWKLVSPQDAVEHTIKGAKNYSNITDKTLENIGHARNKWNEVTGNNTVAPAEDTNNGKPKITW